MFHSGVNVMRQSQPVDNTWNLSQLITLALCIVLRTSVVQCETGPAFYHSDDIITVHVSLLYILVHLVFQTSTKRAVETTDMTRSFGWDSSEGSRTSDHLSLWIFAILSHLFCCYSLCCYDWLAAWQQHDVQELCRVMFDALERSWKNTDQAELITQLYQGKIKDYVKCLQVSTATFSSHAFHLYMCSHIFLSMCVCMSWCPY